MRVLHISILAATFAGISILSPIIRFFTQSSSYFPIYPRPELFAVSMLLCIGAFCLIFSLFSLTSLLERTKAPYEAILNALIICFAVFSQVLNFLDIGFERSTQVRANPSFLEISVFTRRPIFEIKYKEESARIVGSTVFEEIFDQFRINPVLFPVMTIFIIALAGILITMLIYNFKEVLISFGLKLDSVVTKEEKADWRMPFWAYLLFGLSGLCYFTLFITYICMPNGKINSFDLVAPASWVFIKSGVHSDISKAQELEAIREYRALIELPDDRDWLDQRDYPVYPLVTADKVVVNAYNQHYNRSIPLSKKEFHGETPDVFVVLIESFSPTPYYMDKEFIPQNESIYKGRMYDTDFLPNLDRIEEQGIAFSGLSSNSLPTFGGWFSFVCGDYQPNYGSSMTLDSYNDLDDLPSFMRTSGYYTEYITTSPLDFDGKMQYAFRGNKQLRGPSHLSSFPKWFDDIHWYFPTPEQAIALNLSNLPKPSAWVCDRITSKQVMDAVQRYTGDEPLFTLWTTVDTHTPFKGFDSISEYNKYTFNDGMHSSYDEQGMSDRYSTILRYTDEEVGELYDYLKQHRNNTIMVILGDHGARDMNTFESDPHLKNMTFAEECRGEAFGNEELFTTTGIISYLGEDAQVQQNFENHIGKVLTIPTDQQDVVYTIQKLISEFNHAEHVTSRQGRDLFELFSIKARNHISIRNTGLSLEIATESKVIRSNYLTNHGAIVISDASYPTCITEKQENISHLDKDEFNEYLLISALFTKLSHENRNFNYAFRDINCVANGTCVFPELSPTYKSPVLLNCYITLPCALVVFCIIFSVICELVAKQLNYRYKYIMETDHWWVFSSFKHDISEINLHDSYI